MKLIGKRIAVFVEEGFEDLEFWVPVMRLREEGATVTVVGTRMTIFRGKNGLEATPDTTPDLLNVNEFEAVVIPGGWAPDKLRRYTEVTDFVRQIHQNGKIVATICHGGLVLISAGIVAGHKVTGSLGIKDDLVNAGGVWIDASAFRDGNQVWGRVVADIPDFCRELVEALAE